MEPPRPIFDVQSLLITSQPRPRLGRMGYAAGLIVILLVMAFAQSRASQDASEALGTVVMFGVIGGMSLLTWWNTRAFRQEIGRLVEIEELVQLRRWPQAAMLLQGMLGNPTRTQQGRLQALVYLSNVLTRFHQFDDVIQIDDYLLETVRMDDMTAHAVRLGRAMALLREDRLLDADRAISELRRSPPADTSAGLALLEMYRDVKTGHPNEAIGIFQKKLALLRAQLSHRIADIYALVARAYDMLNQGEEARSAWQTATLMAPPAELLRRYTELAGMEAKYPVTLAPREAVE